jgi:5-hydroxyisourate hydrolase-like protein (transthyretin family)
MRTKNRLARLVVFALLLAAISSACEPVTQVHGTVRDKNGSPVADVSITMYSTKEGQNEKTKESEQKTDASGKFNFVSITPEAKKVSLTLKKDGYVTAEKEIQANGQGEIDVVLETARN